MSSKRPSSVSTLEKAKKSRKSINLSMKMDVIHRFEAGERAVDIASALDLTPTTVHTMRNNAEKIKSTVESASAVSASKVTRTRNVIMEKNGENACNVD
ncbi:hypothetical protein ANN_04939 [Periplaneta americana]|uniref:HTH psq-type domain-containing protein n=1 Tax=Periplaneta americana TaxID=6978 RepID=A0ABQ8TAZ7_PERAM|nr:hypothetical protein ANN_04939 [Periplaneta americana]